jgi:predicted AlkP superfamily phosphohydrolase/phosphomutase
MSKKVIIVGWDGATFKVLEPLIDKGLLPNLAALKKAGTFGVLESVLPTLTPTAWATFATGKNPGRHGCYDWFKNEGSLKKRKLVSSNDIEGETFYELLERAGKKPILINLPLSSPSRVRDGIVVSSFLAGEEVSVHPPELVEGIKEFADFRPFFKAYEEYRSEEEFVADVRAIAQSRFALAKRLFEEEWDLFFCLFSASDWIQHKIPSVVEGNLSESALELFKDLDRYLGYFVKNLPGGGALFLISDHGFKVYEGEFAVNRWLEEEGYLVRRAGDNPTERQRFRDAGESFPGKFRWGYFLLGRSAFLYTAVGLFARALSRFFPVPFLKRLGRLGLEVDPFRTIAYSPPGTSGEIYLNRRGVFEDGLLSESRAEEVKEEIVTKLGEEFSSRKRGKRWKVYAREDLYGEDCLKSCPDIILEPLTFFASSGFQHELLSLGKRAEHDRKGVFFARGPRLPQGVKVEGVRLEDIAPTILKEFGISSSEEMEGKPLDF